MLAALKHHIRDAVFFLLARMSPRRLAGVLYQRSFHRPLNWNHPRDINEKINWLKFYGDTSEWPLLADKLRVRSYVEARGLGDLLVPLYGSWERVEDISWDALPDQFVMKANNGCGDALLCADRQTLDIPFWTNHFREVLGRKFGYRFAEPHYNKILPRVLAEQLLDATRQPVTSSSLLDYKVWSFDGHPAYVVVYHNRTRQATEVAVYDLKWQPHPEFVQSSGHYRPSRQDIPRPQTLERMLEAASVLSKGQPQVRVDFYEVDGRLYFGEMTLTASAGYNTSYTEDFRLLLGQCCKLPCE